jgi:hypothetical protein
MKTFKELSEEFDTYDEVYEFLETLEHILYKHKESKKEKNDTTI